jgi:hypothetical protein
MMMWFRRLMVVGATAVSIATLPVIAYAQEANISGGVKDATGGVLPGVTLQAVQIETGNSFEAVTDARGEYRLPVRAGVYRISAELQGFAPFIRTGLELLIGQQAVINIQMSPQAVAESITVTGEAPLVDVKSSSLGTNIDPRQMKELPINGRNWMDLALLAAGNRANKVGNDDEMLPRPTGTVQINLDGQQITDTIASNQGQPHFSRDSIAEFEFVSTMFDATQGRSSGVQVNAISKSGTNIFGGSAAGYFRNDRFVAEDFIAHRVLPYSDTQLSATFGGPIRKDRVHFFANYEYEREPQTFTYSSVYPLFNVDQRGVRWERKGGARVDAQFSAHTRLAVRGARAVDWQPYQGSSRISGGSTSHPSGANSRQRSTNDVLGTLTTVLSNSAVNELRGGVNTFYWLKDSVVKWKDSPTGRGMGAPQINLIGYRIGQSTPLIPNEVREDRISVRDDFTYSFNSGGRHNMKLGGEYLRNFSQGIWYCSNMVGTYDAQGGPIPANIQDLFPVWNDYSTWNLAAISPIVRKYSSANGDCNPRMPQNIYAAWAQDDWTVMPRLTLNLGIRYDLYAGAYAEWTSIPPFFGAGRHNDTNNFGPRLGATFAVNDRTVIRGGFGKYFAQIQDTAALWPVIWSQQAGVEVLNDGRPDFAANPFNGPRPTYQQMLTRACDTALVANCLRRTLTSLPAPDAKIPYSYQSSVGLQRQFGSVSAISADYVFTASRDDTTSQNVNLGFDPVTGVNYPFTNIALRPYPAWGSVQMGFPVGRSTYHALQTGFTKRMSNRWQVAATYTLAGLWDLNPKPVVLVHDASGIGVSSHPVSFAVPADLGGEWGLATTDQRHRANVNAIWQLGYGVQLSGVYFYGSGLRYDTTYGGDPRGTGGGASRLRPNGTLVPRNAFVGRPVHRVDLRFQKTVKLVGHAQIDGMLEAFNVFNHANYSAFTTQESSAKYGQPSEEFSLANTPRMLQLGFRLGF